MAELEAETVAKEEAERAANQDAAAQEMVTEQKRRASVKVMAGVHEQLERSSNQNEAAAAMDEEQARRKSQMVMTGVTEQLERSANQNEAAEAMDEEQARRKSQIVMQGVTEQLERSANQSAAADALDEEQARRKSQMVMTGVTEQLERTANQNEAAAAQDDEQKLRMSQATLREVNTELERTHNQNEAAAAQDDEQKRRVSQAMLKEVNTELERTANQKEAIEAMDEEKAVRTAMEAKGEMHGDLERKTNQAEAKAMAEEEQERRISADKAEGLEKRPSFVVEKGVLADLKPDEAPALKPTPSKAEVAAELGAAEEPTELEKAAEEKTKAHNVSSAGGGAAEEPEEPVPAAAAASVASAAASANVDDIMSKDADDEALQKYKAQLLGAAATGDTGDKNDPRKVIIEEFRVIFNSDKTDDFATDLTSEASIAALKKTGVSIKEGSEYKFRITFRVNGEILDCLVYTVSLSKMGISMENDVEVLGSYAPQSEPHVVEYPKNGWYEAPMGFMMRSTYTAHCKFTNRDGSEVYLDYAYPIKITS